MKECYRCIVALCISYGGIEIHFLFKIQAAYNTARAHGYWSSGYQMANAEEYWAVASSSYFNAEHNQNKDMN